MSVGIRAIAAAVAKAGSKKPVANVNKETTERLREAAQRKDYEELARIATHNPDSNKVMLGKYDNGGPTSYVTRAGNEYTYFGMTQEDWVMVSDIVGEGNMWKINEAFLNQQIAAKKVFYASHSIANATSSFEREIGFLNSNGVNINQLWWD